MKSSNQEETTLLIESVPSEAYINHCSERRGPAVEYDTSSSFLILFQMHASVWKRVILMCVFNSVMAIVIFFYDKYYSFEGFDLSFSDSGHIFMSLMVSFLIVSRSNNSLNKYMSASTNLNELMKNSRELIQLTIALTRYGENNSYQGMKWRVDVAKRIVSLLRVITSNLQRASTGINVWEQEGLTNLEKQAMLLAVGKSNERAPYVLTIFLRSVIASHVDNLPKPLEVVQELQLLEITSKLIRAYNHLMKDIDTPYPFPLVQMTRTFLFCWVFTLPMVLSNDIEELFPLVFVVFFLTYGFMGLELVSIEMDDPYGDDPNDFHVQGIAEVVISDIEVYLYDIDGEEAVERMNRKMKSNTSNTALEKLDVRNNIEDAHSTSRRRKMYRKQNKANTSSSTTTKPPLHAPYEQRRKQERCYQSDLSCNLMSNTSPMKSDSTIYAVSPLKTCNRKGTIRFDSKSDSTIDRVSPLNSLRKTGIEFDSKLSGISGSNRSRLSTESSTSMILDNSVLLKSITTKDALDLDPNNSIDSKHDMATPPQEMRKVVIVAPPQSKIFPDSPHSASFQSNNSNIINGGIDDDCSEEALDDFFVNDDDISLEPEDLQSYESNNSYPFYQSKLSRDASACNFNDDEFSQESNSLFFDSSTTPHTTSPTPTNNTFIKGRRNRMSFFSKVKERDVDTIESVQQSKQSKISFASILSPTSKKTPRRSPNNGLRTRVSLVYKKNIEEEMLNQFTIGSDGESQGLELEGLKEDSEEESR